jgi:hypothetical protein
VIRSLQRDDTEDIEKMENELYRELMDILSTRYFHATEEKEVSDGTSAPSPHPQVTSSSPAGTEAPNNPQAVADIVLTQLAPLLQQQLTAIREELLKAQSTTAKTKK